MRSVFAGCPVVANELEQSLGCVLLGRGAGGVEAVFLVFLDDLAFAQFLLFPPYRDKLPAAAQAGLLGTDPDSLDSPAHQSPMFLGPVAVVLSGKKKLGATGLEPAPELPLGCL